MGKRPPPCEGVVKPSYRFYGHYNGMFLPNCVLNCVCKSVRLVNHFNASGLAITII